MTDEDADILRRRRLAPEEAYGERLRRVILFGSRARGDHFPDLDDDLAIILDRVDDWWRETQLLHEIRREGVAV